MQTVRGAADLHAALAPLRAEGRGIVLVPTMGNLHAGHLELIRCARRLGDFVVVSIYVNPFQFGEDEDFDTYPRTLESDRRELEALDVDLLFLPETADIYPDGPRCVTQVEVPELSTILCGETRPTFFRGVATVVTILFNLVCPRVAVFGEKDYQQLVIIRRMVADLQMGVEIATIATVREPDGLAISSRNSYLTARERALAPALYGGLIETRDKIRGGDHDYQALGCRTLEQLEMNEFRPEYVSVRRRRDLAIPLPGDRELVVLAAARLGNTRLIDNVSV